MAAVSSLDEIGARAQELLREGPRTPAELVAALTASGLRLGADATDLLFEVLDDEHAPIGDRWVHLPSALHGSRWWIDVPADADDALVLDHGVDVLTWFPWERTALLDGDGATIGDVRAERAAAGTRLVGPSGWLTAVAGRAAVLEYWRDGIVLTAAAHLGYADGTPPEPAAALATAMREAFDHEAEPIESPYTSDDEPLLVAEPGITFVRAFTDAGEVLRSQVLPPIDRLVDAVGLERHEHLLGPRGTDWGALATSQRFHALKSHHDLSDDQTSMLMMLLGASAAVRDGDPDALGEDDEERRTNAQGLGRMLGGPAVCRAFVHESIERGRTPDEVLRFAELVLAHAGEGPSASGLLAVQAECLDLLDRTPEAITALERAVSLAPHPRAHVMLAGFAADRGDAAEAARLLRAGGVRPDDERLGAGLWAELQPFLARPKATAGRNDPCPCGSGRKYKACHLGREVVPLADRAAWLYRKASRFVAEHLGGEHGGLAMALVDAAGGGPELLSQVIDTELVYDVTLDEAGGLRRFLERRGSLLPDDERELASLWLLADRGLYRVDDQGRDHLVLTDLAAEQPVRIDHVRGMRLDVGSHVMARLVQVGPDLVSFFGYVPVPSRLLDEVADVLANGDADDVAEVIGRCFAPEYQDDWLDDTLDV